MPDPKSQPAPITTPAPAPKAPAATPPAVAPAAAANVLAIDERFAQLAAEFMSQVNAQMEAFHQQILTQVGTNVDPLHQDLHDLLDAQTAQGARLDKIEAADFITPEALQQHLGELASHVAEQLAPKIQPVVQPVVNVNDIGLADRLAKLESRLRYF
jgi:hypothetical protein